MLLEEFCFIFQRNFNRDFILDILLRPVNNTNIPKLEPDFLIEQHFLSTGSLIHDVNLGDNTDSPLLLHIPLSGQFETIGGWQVLICGDNTQDNSLGVNAVSFCHFCCDALYILLPFHVDSGNAGQIDDGQVGAVYGEYFQLYRVINNVGSCSRHIVR